MSTQSENPDARSSAAVLATILWVVIVIALIYGVYKAGSLVPALFE